MGRTAIAILSTEHLHHNISVIRKKNPLSKIVAMVKANGYGHGIRSVSKRLENHADLLGVASIDEALALRKAGVSMPILLIEGVFESFEYITAATEGFHVVVHSETQMEWLRRLHLPCMLSVWLKVDTGLGRLGFSLEKAHLYYTYLLNHPKISKPVKVMSHFSCADQKDHDLNRLQIEKFKEFTETTEPSFTEYSFCNSAGIFNFTDQAFDYVRPGLALYGVSPLCQNQAHSLDLKPVMTLQSSLISVSYKDKGSSIGYGARYTCSKQTLVGIIAFGYGDGYPITAMDGTPVLIHGVECPLIGRVSMDMMSVDLSPLEEKARVDEAFYPRVGDVVVLWGEGLPLERIATYTQNLTYDILTGVQHRVKFLWTTKDISH